MQNCSPVPSYQSDYGLEETELLCLLKHVASDVHERFPWYTVKDLMGDGFIGYSKAIKRYDPGYGASVKTYVRRRIEGEMLDRIYKDGQKKRTQKMKLYSLDLIIDETEEDNIPSSFMMCFPQLYTNNCEPYDVLYCRILKKALNKLSASYRKVIVLKWYLEYTDKEIADKLKCTKQNVEEKLSRALEVLKEYITGIDKDIKSEVTG